MVEGQTNLSRRNFLTTASAATAAMAVLPEFAFSQEAHMDIQRVGSGPSGKGPSDRFTGTVRIDAPFDRPDPSRVNGASVTFEPGARTAWHTHPLGQTLIVVSGLGWAQQEGGPVEEIRPGDVGVVPAGRPPLARGQPDDGDDAHRRSGEAQRLARHLDGEGHRRAVPQVSRRPTREDRPGDAQHRPCVHELLPVRADRGGLAAPDALHRGRRRPPAVVRRGRAPAGGRAEGTAGRPGRGPRGPVRPGEPAPVRQARGLLQREPEVVGQEVRHEIGSTDPRRHGRHGRHGRPAVPAVTLSVLCCCDAGEQVPRPVPATRAAGQPQPGREAMSLKLRVKVGPKTLAATLEDNPATAGFRQMLPLTLDMPDLNANEKRARLPERLSTDPIKPGTDAERTQGRKNASGARRAGGADRTQPFPLPWVPLSTGGGACLASAF